MQKIVVRMIEIVTQNKKCEDCELVVKLPIGVESYVCEDCWYKRLNGEWKK